VPDDRERGIRVMDDRVIEDDLQAIERVAGARLRRVLAPLVDGALVEVVELARAVRALDASLLPGIDFSAKTLLEVAVALLGLSIGVGHLANAGFGLAGLIVGVVLVSIGASYSICRLLGIGKNLAALVASGNAICGNSAIVAVAPAIRASREDVASAITFSALLSVVVVLCLPLSLTLLALDEREYGILAGLTIYAVPQVFAATSPAGLHAVQVGTIVKLVRVMMLGPVVVAMAALTARKSTSQPPVPDEWGGVLSFGRMVPPFIIAFLLLAVIGTTGFVPPSLIAGATALSKALALVAMAGLGLCVDVRQILHMSIRLILAVTASLLVLVAISIAAIRFLGT
jgi:uncharacterized integral membrane protein (TIGR00698 family)